MKYDIKPARLEKLSKKEQMELVFDLLNAFRLSRNIEETAEFIKDLFTAKEIKNLSKRLRIAKLLLAGKTQEEIVNMLHTSFVTVTKISLWLSQGGSGLKKTIAKLPTKYEIPEKLPTGPIAFHLPETVLTIAKYSLAKSQERSLENFLEKVEDKKISDQSLQEAVNEEFRDKKNL